jgi:pimeloyl-ACP methyl ester carboxylesterase
MTRTRDRTAPTRAHGLTRRDALGLTAAAALAESASAPALAEPTDAGTRPATGAQRVRVWRQYVDADFVQIHVTSAAPLGRNARSRAAASPTPPLVCFHPSPTTGEMYHDLQRELASDRTVHCPDTPGYGSSDAPAQKPSMQDYGATLSEALAQLLRTDRSGGAKPVRADLFGFHTGSLCALEVALQRPDLVRRVVLSGVPHFEAAERERQRRQNVTGYPYFSDPDYLPRLYRRLVLDARDSGTPEQRLRRFGDRLRAGSNGWWGPDAVFTYDSVQALPRLAKSTLLIAFNEEMTEPTRQAARLVPDARLIEMLDLPIFGFIVAPARVAGAIRDFLR